MIERLVLTNANLIDAVTPGVVAGASVTIEGDRVVEVLGGRRSPATHDARVIDLRGAYLLPGLWDVHVHLEPGLWVKAGATPWETLQAATRSTAEVAGVGRDVGTIEAGKLADLIAVRDNPLDDIDNVRTLELVFKGGRLVADHRPTRATLRP
jgi:imidazolonepropionase-like amidohydrolase